MCRARPALRFGAAVLALLTLLVGCANGGGRTTIHVLAAASLTESFTAIGHDFESAYSDNKVVFDFEGSPMLATKIKDGAPADVFASADQVNMKAVTDAHRSVGTPVVVGRNVLQIVVGRGNPKKITGLADLARDGLTVVECAPQVPCGRLARLALGKAGVDVTPASDESDVKAVVSKVALGEADAGIAYSTDVRAAQSQVSGVDIAGSADPDLEATYPMVVVTQSGHKSEARRFIDFVKSPSGQAVLARFGFLSP